jgi:hypothetical protein
LASFWKISVFIASKSCKFSSTERFLNGPSTPVLLVFLFECHVFRKVRNLHRLFRFNHRNCPIRTTAENNRKHNVLQQLTLTKVESSLIASTYSCSSLAGLVSSKRKFTGALC